MQRLPSVATNVAIVDDFAVLRREIQRLGQLNEQYRRDQDSNASFRDGILYENLELSARYHLLQDVCLCLGLGLSTNLLSSSFDSRELLLLQHWRDTLISDPSPRTSAPPILSPDSTFQQQIIQLLQLYHTKTLPFLMSLRAPAAEKSPLIPLETSHLDAKHTQEQLQKYRSLFLSEREANAKLQFHLNRTQSKLRDFGLSDSLLSSQSPRSISRDPCESEESIDSSRSEISLLSSFSRSGADPSQLGHPFSSSAFQLNTEERWMQKVDALRRNFRAEVGLWSQQLSKLELALEGESLERASLTKENQNLLDSLAKSHSEIHRLQLEVKQLRSRLDQGSKLLSELERERSFYQGLSSQ